MKNIITIAFIMFLWLGHAHNFEKGGEIILKVYLPEHNATMPLAAQQNLEGKMSQIVVANGMGGGDNSRFLLTAQVVLTSKEITPTAPPMQALTMDIVFYIGDGVDGTLFAKHAMTLKGVGTNETKAYNAAIRNIKSDSNAFLDFISNGKNKIISYYDNKCETLIKQSQLLAKQGEYDEAIYLLTAIPEASARCYDKAMLEVAAIYKMKINKECKSNLALANNAWIIRQDYEGASEAVVYLSRIDPDADCYAEAKLLSTKISEKIRQNEKREWDFKMKELQNDTDITKERINAARAIGVAYAQSRPQIIYNVRGWW